MARGPREKPERLVEKLLAVRLTLGLSQTEILKQPGAEDKMVYIRISEFESGEGEPSLMVLLAYARLAGICVEVLIDDELDLPSKLPRKPKHKPA